MELRVIQNHKGKFYLGSSEETLSFVLAIYDEENKIIEVDGIKARLSYMGDREPFDSPLDDMPNVFNECFDYAKGVISSTPYEKECLLFAKIYQENFEGLDTKMKSKKQVEIETEIERLQKRLKYLNGIDDISWDVNNKLNKKIEIYTKWRDSAEKELEQIKENTDKHKEILEKVERYNKEIEFYNNSKVQEHGENIQA
jgi:hypothetical protein